MKSSQEIVLRLPVLLLLLFIGCETRTADPEAWITDYEKSGFVRTPGYEETVAYVRKLEGATEWLHLTSFGCTAQGRELPLVVLSSDEAFTPGEAHQTGKPVVLIQSGIHAGEIDGKDASLMLMRDMAVSGELQELSQHVIVLFVPIFNLDGHERKSRWNRINQNGPEEMGWRVTANNLNLNRDFMKADSPEMRSWLKLFNTWMPDMVIDCHVTNGIDFQYNLSYSMENYENSPIPVVEWQKKLEHACIRGMKERGDPICPYVFPRENKDISLGMSAWASPPRFSTGYAAIRNRAALLIETHMLKPYKARVTATYRLLVEVLEFIGSDPESLRDAVSTADKETVQKFSAPQDSATFPLRFQGTGKYSTITFLGYASGLRKSTISGGEYRYWDHSRPEEMKIPYYNDIQPTLLVRPPMAYLVPQEWSDAVDILRLHGVRLGRLTRDTSLTVETYVFSEAEWRRRPYEGRHAIQRVRHSTRIDTLHYPAGTYLVRLDQPSAGAAIHVLEPDGPDSFVRWGFFDAVFERKEYFESYVMEDVGRQMLEADTALRAEYETRLAEDREFASSQRARMMFLYKRSPYFDRKMNVYPVGRHLRAVNLPAVPEKGYSRKMNISAD